MAQVRDDVTWLAVADVIKEWGSGHADIVDVGGGTGGAAVHLAKLGHRVSVIDTSPDSLASLHRRAAEAQVEVVGVQADASEVAEVIGESSADVVLCHQVLHLVEDPQATVAAIAQTLRPNGIASFVFPGRYGAVISRLAAGDLDRAEQLLINEELFTAESAMELINNCGMRVEHLTGLRTIVDVVPGYVLDGEPNTKEQFLRIERVLAELSPFAQIASGLHCTARID